MRDPETTSRIMSSIRSKDTSIEKAIRKRLWARGIRYRVQFDIEGKPDIALPNLRIAIFCDGDFWHGNNWRIRGMKSLDEELAGYSDFWRKKIIRNVERDRAVDRSLVDKGWLVIRVWESEIKENPDRVVSYLVKAIEKRRGSLNYL